ncbi:pyridoxamine 5'-phosphate oxidase [Aequorivita antarctica]|uniref:Pyridoxine/pyridoxamine 5'-phosphate oxidase n=1 Tax=Aequorivita antarctica TaxID=153266 RepID=A0A5C6Z2B8_9FLAO|nr:pyridoxamine 5'-phosphate oxidase [Aequorivita antarctica]TXD74257.1 pyridoxamine 5'-phosphate oxidase [Aequorivita antarctica]SRX73597.1 Pyridoxine/pyridoxamine 5'-phosphate oxidase [Aequorivita antarctica]
MAEKLHHYRKSYEKGELSEVSVDENPMQQFRTWFFEVKDNGGVDEVNAMTISTIGSDGFPKGRVVLLKKYDEYGFYFYTNYNSEKGKSITNNNKVSLSFFWPNMERQIIIKGIVEKTSEADSTNYFHSRPKGSQLGAAVSHQSTVVESREVLEKNLAELEKKYENQEVPKPTDWGGFLVKPISIEFWQGRPNRLHDRIRYTLKDDDWVIERLAP